jgi:hypothetical protein
MEAVFLVQPWVQARTALDCCKLCYQKRLDKSHLESKRAYLSACNELVAALKLEKDTNFEVSLQMLEEARENCINTPQPDEYCHAKSQESLYHALNVYDRILADYKKQLPNRSNPTPAN